MGHASESFFWGLTGKFEHVFSTCRVSWCSEGDGELSGLEVGGLLGASGGLECGLVLAEATSAVLGALVSEVPG